MSDEPQFNLDFDPLLLEQELAAAAPSAADAPAEVEPPPAQAAPVVVVQYRNRGLPPILLFPATLILSLGMFAAYHVLFVIPRQRELQEQARAAALAASAAAPPAPPKVDFEPDEPFPGAKALSLDGQPFFPGFDPSSGIVPVPDAARIVAKPVASPEPAAKEPEPAGETAVVKAVAAPVVDGGSAPSPFGELNGGPASPPEAVAEAPAAKEAPAPATPKDAEAKAEPPREVAMSPPPEVPKDVAEPVADAPEVDDRPTPTPEEMQRALEAEVEARRAERDEQVRMKAQARAQVEAEAQNRVESERSLFREELKRIVSAGGPTAGQEIDELCDKYGRTYGGELKAQVLGVISRHHGKVTRDVEVRLLRSLGVPEPGILDYLAQMLHRTTMNRRNGAHDSDGVRVLAAKLLLRMPLLSNPAVGVGAPASPSRRRQAPAARGAIAGPAR
jgi:hypothetical protein